MLNRDNRNCIKSWARWEDVWKPTSYYLFQTSTRGNHSKSADPNAFTLTPELNIPLIWASTAVLMLCPNAIFLWWLQKMTSSKRSVQGLLKSQLNLVSISMFLPSYFFPSVDKSSLLFIFFFFLNLETLVRFLFSCLMELLFSFQSNWILFPLMTFILTNGRRPHCS